jgi:acetyl-CoA carboxylase carboxyl transferase subunit alpha
VTADFGADFPPLAFTTDIPDFRRYRSRMYNYLDFEKPVADLEGQDPRIEEARRGGEAVDVAEEIARLEKALEGCLRDIYKALTPWQKAQVARHPDRPHCLDYVASCSRTSRRWPATARSARTRDRRRFRAFPRRAGRRPRPGKGLGHQDAAQAQFRHGRPEGYRKAVRIMELADRFSIPVITLVDTAGAYPGIGAEERGQAEAIARSTSACLA